jgi:hypothetical protein
MANGVFWRLHFRLQILVVRTLVWLHARVLHEHVWVGVEYWNAQNGVVKRGAYCAICGKRQEWDFALRAGDRVTLVRERQERESE